HSPQAGRGETKSVVRKHNFAFSPRVAREFCFGVPPSRYRGRRECRAPDAPAAARGVVVNTRVSHHGHTGNTRHSPRNGFTAYFVLSPVTGLVCHRRLRFVSQTWRQRRGVRTTRP